MSYTVDVVVRLIDEASEAVEAFSSNIKSAMEQTAESTDRVTATQRELNSSLKNLVTGISQVATGAFSLYQAFDRVQDAQLNLQRANIQVQASLIALEEAQKRYNMAVEKYGEESPQAQEALRSLQLAQEKYSYAVERASVIQGNLNELMVQSALSVIPTAITMIDGLVKAKQTWTTVQYALNAALAANPIGAIITIIGILIGVLIAAYQTCEPFRNAVNAVWNALSNALKPAVDAVIGAFTWLWQNVITPLIGWLRKLWDTIINNPILSALLTPITAIIHLIQNWETVTKSLQAAWDSFCRFLDWAYQAFIKPVADAIGAFVNTIKGAVDTVRNALGGFKDAVGNAFSGALNAIQNFIGRVCFAHAIAGAVEESEKNLNNWVKSIRENMSRAYEHIKNFNLGLSETRIALTPPTAGNTVTISINAPLINIEGSADKRTAELAVSMIEKRLKTVIIEATSRNAPTKRIQIAGGLI